jgi:hypothetical protein
MPRLFTLNDGTRIAVKDGVIDEKEYAYPKTALEAFPWRFGSGCELVHEEHQRDRCHGGRSVGQWPSSRPEQRPLPPSAGLLVKQLRLTPEIGGSANSFHPAQIRSPVRRQD